MAHDKWEEPDRITRKKALNWMVGELFGDRADYFDGEWNSTLLAERYADEFDVYCNDAEATIPEWVFEVAVEAAAYVEKKTKKERVA